MDRPRDKWLYETCDFTIDFDSEHDRTSLSSPPQSFYPNNKAEIFNNSIGVLPILKQSPLVKKKRDLSPPVLTACRLRDLPPTRNATCDGSVLPPKLQPFTLYDNFEWDPSFDMIPLPDISQFSSENESLDHSNPAILKCSEIDLPSAMVSSQFSYLHPCLGDFLNYVTESVAYLLSFQSQHNFLKRQWTHDVYDHVLTILKHQLLIYKTSPNYANDALKTSVWFGIIIFLKDLENKPTENDISIMFRGLRRALDGLQKYLSSAELSLQHQ